MGNLLKIGDKVNWKGTFGKAPQQEATIKNIYINNAINKKVDFKLTSLTSVEWDKVNGRDYIVDLTNDSWAYANQISRIEE